MAESTPPPHPPHLPQCPRVSISLTHTYASGSSSMLCNPSKYGCASASAADMREAGANINSFAILPIMNSNNIAAYSRECSMFTHCASRYEYKLRYQKKKVTTKKNIQQRRKEWRKEEKKKIIKKKKKEEKKGRPSLQIVGLRHVFRQECGKRRHLFCVEETMLYQGIDHHR